MRVLGELCMGHYLVTQHGTPSENGGGAQGRGLGWTISRSRRNAAKALAAAMSASTRHI